MTKTSHADAPTSASSNVDGTGSWPETNLTDGQARLVGREWFTTARRRQYPLGPKPATWLVIG